MAKKEKREYRRGEKMRESNKQFAWLLLKRDRQINPYDVKGSDRRRGRNRGKNGEKQEIW
jgi:hypothetical protein